MRKKTCGRVTIKLASGSKDDGYYDLDAWMGGKRVGLMELERHRIETGREALVVHVAEVDSPGCGIGTKLYEYAAALACKDEVPLASDSVRTGHSEGLWAKQERKGRARCLRFDKNEKRRYGVKLDWNTGDAIGEWDCRRYVMIHPCMHAADLSRPAMKRRR